MIGLKWKDFWEFYTCNTMYFMWWGVLSPTLPWAPLSPRFGHNWQPQYPVMVPGLTSKGGPQMGDLLVWWAARIWQVRLHQKGTKLWIIFMNHPSLVNQNSLAIIRSACENLWMDQLNPPKEKNTSWTRIFKNSWDFKTLFNLKNINQIIKHNSKYK